MRLALVVAGMAAALSSTPASAAQFMFDFTSTSTLFGSPPISGTGVFTTSDVVTRIGGQDALAITGISGLINGTTAITGLFDAPGNPTYYYFTSGPFFLDGSGVRFNAGSFTNISFFAQSTIQPPNNPYRVTGFGTILATVNATSSPVTAAVPEPATWAMMLLGFGAVGYAMRRRRARVQLGYAA